MWQQWTNMLLGLLVIAVPFAFNMSSTLMWTLVILGAAIAILGIWGAQETTRERHDGRMRHHSQH